VSQATLKVVTGILLAVGIATGFTAVAAADTVQRIGKEALIGLPEGALWSAMVNFRPGDGEIVKLNPPPFSWLYKDDDPNSTRDEDTRIFQFQVAYDKEFKELAVDVRTESNMYNFIAPFNKEQCWWRVGYIYPKKGPAVDHWSKVRAFVIADDAKEWDRSMLADEQYLKSKAHPRLLFNSTNRAAFSAHMATNESAIWLQIKAVADAAILSDWWRDSIVTQTAGYGRLATLQAVAFTWQMTHDAKYLDSGKAQTLLVKAAKEFIDSGSAWEDPIGGRGGIQYLAQAYDWLYETMTLEQQTEVAKNIGLHCKFVIYASTFYFPIVRANDNYALGFYPTNNRREGRGTADNYMESHLFDNLGYSMFGALAAYSEDAGARQLLDLTLNLHIGRPYYAGNEEGMDAGAYVMPDVNKVLERSLMCQFAFPEVHFNLNPYFTGIADWFSRIRPVGAEAEMFTWGDTNNQMYTPFAWWGKYFAWYSGDGRALKQWREETKLFPMATYRLRDDMLAACSFYLTAPGGFSAYSTLATYVVGNKVTAGEKYYTCVLGHDSTAHHHVTETTYWQEVPSPEEDRLPVSKAFSGWAMAASAPTNTIESFRNGLGFIFCCRPSAIGGRCHAAAVDLSFELWAYGQTITENGCGNWEYNKIPESHNSLLVNGVGVAPTFFTPLPGRIFAFKTTPDYTYCAGDGLNLYPATTIAILNKVRRHMIMVRNKFFVIFDEMEAKQPARFSWVYHLLEDNLKLDPATPGTFSYQRTKSAVTLENNYVYPGKPVSVYVSHIASPAGVEVLDQSGDKRTTNPITGQSFPIPPGARSDYRTHAVWVSNKTPEMKVHFMTVIYPVKQGSVAPTITRLDDLTAEVTCGAEKDVISFDPKTRFPATLVVDLFGIPAPKNPAVSGPGVRTTP
jgi:hypothetical protein